MKSLKSIGLAIVALSSVASFSTAFAGGVAQPAGIFTVPVVGPNKLNLVATPFARPAVAEGTISVQSGKVLTVSTVPTMTAGLPYVVEVLDGDYIGAISLITANTGSTVTVEYNFPAGAITAGTRYAIRPDWTISTLLGSAATSQVGSSTSYGGGDVVSIFNSATQKLENFWRQRTGSSPNFAYTWRTQEGAVADNVRIPLGEGFVIKRVSATQLNLRLAGEFRQARARKEILGNGKLTIIANPNPYPLLLSKAGLTPTAATSAGGAASADNVHFINPNTGAFVTYWRNSSDNNNWYNAAGELASGTTIDAGKAVIMQRNGGRGDLTGKSAARVNPVSVANAPGI